MNQITPDFESVFTPEYWEPIPDRAEPRKFSEAIRPYRVKGSRESYAMAREKLLIAGSQLIENEPTELIQPGELVGGPDDVKYALPGAVLVIDEEAVLLRAREAPAHDYHRRITSENELTRSAITTFLQNRTFTKMPDEANYPVYENYFGVLQGPQGRYTRRVNLYAYFVAKNGETSALGLLQWRAEPGEPAVIAPAGLLRHMPQNLSARVGETIHHSWSGDIRGFSRIREAHLCIRGIAEKSKVRSRSKRLALALSSSPVGN